MTARPCGLFSSCVANLCCNDSVIYFYLRCGLRAHWQERNCQAAAAEWDSVRTARNGVNRNVGQLVTKTVPVGTLNGGYEIAHRLQHRHLATVEHLTLQ